MFLEDMSKTTASEMIYFSTKSYIVTPHWNRLTETVLVRGHNICLNGKIRIIIHKLSLSGALYHPMYLSPNTYLV